MYRSKQEPRYPQVYYSKDTSHFMLWWKHLLNKNNISSKRLNSTYFGVQFRDVQMP